MSRAFIIHPSDNVATLLDNATPSDIQLLGQPAAGTLTARENISLGHKVALRPIAAGESIIKFGVAIGVATADIPAGAWIHLHNCRSQFDERSSTLDNESGAPTDTAYT